MAFFLRGLLWLGILGGAATGIAFPTKGAVENIFNKQKLRERGWSSNEAQDYENYWYGPGGFGDKRTKQVNNGKWKEEITQALSNIRTQWGKENVGKGLEEKFDGWITKKKICQNNSNNCYVGDIEFIDKKGETLFGRIPIKDGSELKNVYVKWVKCKDKSTNPKNTKNASAVWVGRSRQQNNSTSSSNQNNESQWKWCLGETS